jgi:Cupin
MDPLSEVFALIEIRTARCTRLEAGGTWALRFPAKPELKFAAVLRGECWITLPDGTSNRLATGDTFLLANAPPTLWQTIGRRYLKMGSRCSTGSIPILHITAGTRPCCWQAALRLNFPTAHLVLDSLPPFMLISADNPSAAILRGTLEILDSEVRNGRMGASLVTRRLADVLLVQALRAYFAMHGNDSAGWIGALTDPRIGAALNLMHGDVAHPWTIEELARAVGMSRSGFALRFKNLVSLPPLDYLLRWRMQLARDSLRREVPLRVSRPASDTHRKARSAMRSSAFMAGHPSDTGQLPNW